MPIFQVDCFNFQESYFPRTNFPKKLYSGNSVAQKCIFLRMPLSSREISFPKPLFPKNQPLQKTGSKEASSSRRPLCKKLAYQKNIYIQAKLLHKIVFRQLSFLRRQLPKKTTFQKASLPQRPINVTFKADHFPRIQFLEIETLAKKGYFSEKQFPEIVS